MLADFGPDEMLQVEERDIPDDVAAREWIHRSVAEGSGLTKRAWASVLLDTACRSNLHLKNSSAPTASLANGAGVKEFAIGTWRMRAIAGTLLT